ncbi:hypothetical protein EVJ58_g7863 [Rhodofomes roseus]|uniref:Alpha-ketoglutarate-dependent dioxygenase AlkB-like domain-containing protein n=1 Tax=Rhodofomes roseus TaxID=34475 RepID=A0A4Y9Y146_9APHY|nr:hypothetical protein EVJ58_g7863 [Rhodofomes roseus]
MTAKGVLIPEEVPPFINKYPDIIARIKATGAFQSSPHGAPNHIIMNEYLPGQGIMPHEDGPAYHPVVATLSLGSHALFHYYRYKPSTTADSASNQGRAIDPDPVFSVFLEPRSLVITRASLYQTHLHGIDGVHADVFPAPSDTASGSSARIANVELLGDAPTRELVAERGNARAPSEVQPDVQGRRTRRDWAAGPETVDAPLCVHVWYVRAAPIALTWPLDVEVEIVESLGPL